MEKNHRLYRRQTSLLLQRSDEELMEQFQGGTLEAFDLLVERYSNRLMNYLYGFLGDMETCRDLLQETFLRVYRNRHSYCRIAKFSTWLYTIAGNLARTEYRRRKRQKIFSLHQVNRQDEAFEVEIEDEAFSPERYTDAAIQEHFLQRALLELPEGFREVVVLRDVQQLSYGEITEITGLPTGTVKSRIHRGRAKLQELLKEVYTAEGV